MNHPQWRTFGNVDMSSMYAGVCVSVAVHLRGAQYGNLVYAHSIMTSSQ